MKTDMEARAAELVIANEEKSKRAAELAVANKELAFQNAERDKRAAELAIANKELAFQNEEKDKRAAELAKVNTSLAQSDELYRDLYDSAPVGYATIRTRDGSISHTNRTFQQMLGYEPDALRNLKAFGLYADTPDGKAKAKTIFEKARCGPSVMGEVLQMERNDGTLLWVELSTSPVLSHDGNITMIRLVAVDITGRREAERERLQTQKLDSLGSLAGGVAHDINNMLLPILSLTPMAMKELPEDSPGHKKLDMVLKAAERMKDMAASILAFSRQDEGELAEIDIFQVYCEAIDFLRSTLPSTITIGDDLDPHVGKVRADPKQIEAALMNLASNARDAMGGKTGELTISLSAVEVDPILARKVPNLRTGTYAKTVFTDTGLGMDRETLKHIYNPYFTTKEKGKGTGLGMAMIFGTVAKYGGAITVSSKVGKGTTFEIYLPLVDLEE